MQRIQHAPQHVALERERVDNGLMLLGRMRMLLDPLERELRITLGLRGCLSNWDDMISGVMKS